MKILPKTPLFLGLDLSTQSFSALLLDARAGEIVARESVHFETDLPSYQHVGGHLPERGEGEVHADPCLWMAALDQLFDKLGAGGVPLEQVQAIAGSAQQHGSIYLKDNFEALLAGLTARESLVQQLAPALARATSPIWMDHSTSAQCGEITRMVGGAQEVSRRSGSVATARFTGPQIRKFACQHPDKWEECRHVHLVSSFFASLFAGRSAAIDVGDGAGMNLMNLTSCQWDPVLLAATAPGLVERLPMVALPRQQTVPIARYFQERYRFSAQCQVGLWSGDNPCSLVGMGASQVGRMVISLGTSDTLFAATSVAKSDPAGLGHVFGNPRGGFMSLFCFRNGSLAREALKNRFGLTWRDFGKKALAETTPGNGGRLILPFLTDESTPLRPSSGFELIAWEREPSAAEWVRGVLEGQFLNMRAHCDGLETAPQEILLTGGASQNDGIGQIVADVFQARVRRLSVPDSAALGAAMMAACSGGYDCAALEAQFSAPDAAGEILPNRELAATYEIALKSFRAALHSNH